jgi:predicted metal-binding protein
MSKINRSTEACYTAVVAQSCSNQWRYSERYKGNILVQKYLQVKNSWAWNTGTKIRETGTVAEMNTTLTIHWNWSTIALDKFTKTSNCNH